MTYVALNVVSVNVLLSVNVEIMARKNFILKGRNLGQTLAVSGQPS